MALAALNTANEIAYLAGVFSWQMTNASYTNPDGTTVSFHVIENFGVPIGQYIAGEINTFNLVNNALGSPLGGQDPNTGLFNTQLTATRLEESIARKYAINRVPLANYDQLIDLGVGSQTLRFNVIFAGTMYQTAMINFIQNLFNNNVNGLGTLTHPFYNTINNVLPISFNNVYSYDKLNCAICEIVFLTSDITHLNPSSVKLNTASQIGEWYVGIQSSVTSIGGTISAIQSGASQLGATL